MEHWTGLCPVLSTDTTNAHLYLAWKTFLVNTVEAMLLCVWEILDLNIVSAQIKFWWSNSTVHPEFAESQQAYSMKIWYKNTDNILSCNRCPSGKAMYSLRYPDCNAHAPYCHLCLVQLNNIFPHCLIKDTIFEKSHWTSNVFRISKQILSENFHIINRIERDMIKMYIGLHVKYPYFCHIIVKLEFSRQSLE